MSCGQKQNEISLLLFTVPVQGLPDPLCARAHATHVKKEKEGVEVERAGWRVKHCFFQHGFVLCAALFLAKLSTLDRIKGVE